MRSLLSSTDSCWNLAESRQFLEFWRNQIWQRQIDQMILTEFWMEFKFCQKGSWNHLEGMNTWNSTEWNPVPLPQHIQCPATPKSIVGVYRQSIWAWSTTPNPNLSQPPSTMSTQHRHLVTITSTHHHPQLSTVTPNDHSMPQPSKNKTRMPPHHSRTKWPHPLTGWTSPYQVPHCPQQHGNQMTNDNIVVHCHLHPAKSPFPSLFWTNI